MDDVEKSAAACRRWEKLVAACNTEIEGLEGRLRELKRLHRELGEGSALASDVQADIDRYEAALETAKAVRERRRNHLRGLRETHEKLEREAAAARQRPVERGFSR